MENAESRITGKVPNVDRQELRKTVNIHAGRESGIVDLHTSDFVGYEQPTPAIVNRLAVGKKPKIPLDGTGHEICFRDAQPESVLVERSCRDIPELAQCLRCVTESQATGAEREQCRA